jgi:L-fuconolactonase
VPWPVSGTVVVEASPWLEDNQWVLDLAAHEPFIVGFVGNLRVGTEVFAGHLKRFAANRLFRGIRLRDRKLEGTLDDPAFVGDLRLLNIFRGGKPLRERSNPLKSGLSP